MVRYKHGCYSPVTSKPASGLCDKDAQPIPGAVVQLDADPMRLRAYRWRTETDLNGNFEWDSAPKDPVWVWVEATGYVPVRDLHVMPDGTPHAIRLKRLPSTGMIADSK